MKEAHFSMAADAALQRGNPLRSPATSHPVTLNAQSLLCQNGFKITSGSEHSDRSGPDVYKRQVVLTKSDLCDDLEQKLSEVSSVAFGVDVLVTTSTEENGYKVLLPFISEGKTIAFIESSGVGKSTLINRLLGKDQLKTNGLRNDDKGRHTTTHLSLIHI